MPFTTLGARPAATQRHKLTDQQQAIVQAYDERHPAVVVEALAGTGKTSTLKAIAASDPRRPGTYLAFNKSVQIEAEGQFPDRVLVTTAHGLAYRAVGRVYGHRLPGNGAPRVSAQAMARKLKVRVASLDSGTLNPVVITRMAQATVSAYMKTADYELTAKHIPARVLGMHSPQDIANVVVPIARAIWDDLANPQGKFYFTHDVYLKLWQLTGGTIPGEYVMFDEAQDADPVIASMVAAHSGQRLYVGDRNQAIYGWRGAVDALSRVQGAVRLPLTQSFRFGWAVADQANLWLEKLGSDLRIRGFDPIKSRVEPLLVPRAILCRGNGTALGWVLSFHEQSVPVALAPGNKQAGKDIERFAWAARDLMKGEGTDHPDLVGFPDWESLVKFVDEEEDTADLKRMVGIINRIGVGKVIDAVRGLVPEEKATVTVSTAHKAKGLEWDSVKVADDFVPKEDEDGEAEPDHEALMLNYVTVTRAKQALDPGPLGDPSLWA